MKHYLHTALVKTVNLTVVFLLVIILYFLSASAISLIGVDAEETSENRTVAIFIHTNGVHTDIVVPAEHKLQNWKNLLPPKHTVKGDTSLEWLAFGWGDKGFYLQTPTWVQLKPSVAFRAMFHLGSSAIHTTYQVEPTPNETSRKIMISEQQYMRLIHYIMESLKFDASGNTVLISGQHYDQHDAFYDAERAYSLFYTCNTWANNALKSCGQKACLWTPFDKAIFRWYN